MRKTVLVGRVTRKSSEIRVTEGYRNIPIPGPWTLRAVIRPHRRAADHRGHFPTPEDTGA